MGVNANLLQALTMQALTMLSQVQSKSSKPANYYADLTGSSAGQEERGRCIWVTGLPESYQDATKLINVFGNFGNVRKVVFRAKKPDGALIELDDARGSIKAVANMRGQKFDGQPIKVSLHQKLASVEEAIDAVANLHNSRPKKFGTMKKDRFEN